jgi:Mannosyltransferase (PIG-V)
MAMTAPALGRTENPLPVRLRDGFPFALKVFGAVWVGWALIGLLGTIIPGQDTVDVPGLGAEPLTGGWHNLLDGGQRADALWYQRIAMSGYRPDDGSAAFFPLYPLAVRVLSLITLLPVQPASFVVAQGSFLGSLCVLNALAAREFSPLTAQRATKYLAVFPTAFFLIAPYAESLFLLLALTTFWFARAGRWQVAAFFATGAALTRSVGLTICLALLVELVRQWRAKRGVDLVPGLAAVLAAPAALGTYCLYWSVLYDDFFAPLSAQRGWGREPMFPLTTLFHAVRTGFEHQGLWLIDLLVVAIAASFIVAGARLIPLCYTVFAAASLLLPLCNAWEPRPLMSVPRFAAVIFPVFFVIALHTQRRWLSNSAVIGAFAGGYTLLGLLFSRNFGLF